MAKRFFNKRQRKLLYQLADGKCAICGNELGEGWHADHIVPRSHGGKTTISNGQALCAPCNIKKSDSMVKKIFTPRKWQEDCRVEFFSSSKTRFAIGAVPGAGKSKVAAWIMQTLMDRNEIDLIIAVSPQGNKKQEWYADFLEYFDIPLDPNYSSQSIFKESKFKGAILTYQGVNQLLKDDLQRICKLKRVGVIADEPHHLSANDESKWGSYFQEAFAEARYMLFLSGTYWREDKRQIPFIPYDSQKKKYVIDYQYTYSDSLLDGNSRKIEFEFYDPNIKFEDEFNDQYFEGKLSDVDPGLLDKCYRKLVMERSSDLKDLIQNALIRLEEIRTSPTNPMPRAGMVIFAPDQEVARSLKKWLYTEDFGFIQATIVISDNEDSPERLAVFKKSDSRVLISVNMISEGIDIPRLRVGVYFSVYKTFLFFMQSIVGRLIRVTQDEYNAYQSGSMKNANFSHAFILKHPKLFEFSRRVEGEIHDAEVREQDKPKEDDEPGVDGPGVRGEGFDFSTLEVQEIGKKEYVIAGRHLEAAISEEIDQIFLNAPEIVDPNTKAYIKANLKSILDSKDDEVNKRKVVYSDPVMDEKRLSDQIKKLCNKIGGLLIRRADAEQKEVFQDVRMHLKEKFKMSLDVKKNDVPFDVLKEARQYLRDLYDELDGSERDRLVTFKNGINNYRYGF